MAFGRIAGSSSENVAVFSIPKRGEPRVDFLPMKKAPISCPDCNSVLKTVSYQIWGTKRFDAKTGGYKEDESLGNTDMEFTCPNCSSKLEPESILGF
jgi:DNA-directed RNA polymerase subunit RPC12/RpoP